MKKRAAFMIGVVFLLLASGGLLWRLILERRRTEAMIRLVEEESKRSADFVVYHAYKDALSEIKSGILFFSSPDGWKRSFQLGSLKVVVESVPSPGEALQKWNSIQAAPGAAALAAKPTPAQATDTDWHSIYNSHKSRAAFRQLQQSSTPSAASEFLDGLERVRILTHPQRLGIESPNRLDPY